MYIASQERLSSPGPCEGCQTRPQYPVAALHCIATLASAHDARFNAHRPRCSPGPLRLPSLSLKQSSRKPGPSAGCRPTCWPSAGPFANPAHRWPPPPCPEGNRPQTAFISHYSLVAFISSFSKPAPYNALSSSSAHNSKRNISPPENFSAAARLSRGACDAVSEQTVSRSPFGILPPHPPPEPFIHSLYLCYGAPFPRHPLPSVRCSCKASKTNRASPCLPFCRSTHHPLTHPIMISSGRHCQLSNPLLATQYCLRPPKTS